MGWGGVVWGRNHFDSKMSSRSPDAHLRCLATAPRVVEVIPTWLSALASCEALPHRHVEGVEGPKECPGVQPRLRVHGPVRAAAPVEHPQRRGVENVFGVDGRQVQDPRAPLLG